MRILIADDESNVRSALRLLLEHESDLSIVAEATGHSDLYRLTHTTKPELLLLDWELSGAEAHKVAASLQILFPNLIIVALSGRPEARQAALAAGAHAFVSKGDPPEQLLDTIRNLEMSA
jgi:DNA-binding NarL/FixJ family response regulator